MRPLLALLLGLALPALAEPAARPPAPEWSKDELKTLFVRVEQAGTLPPDARDVEMARIMGAAYRVLPAAAESPDFYARRVLKKVEPAHPEVKSQQWLMALARRFYLDTGARAEILGRLEPVRSDRQLLETRAAQAKTVAEQIKGLLVIKVDAGELSPVPTAPGDLPESFGCEVFVRGEKVEINKLDRAVFTNHQPPMDAPRTGKGALREMVAAMKEFNMRAAMMGQIDPAMKQSHKKLRVFIPAPHPARYLNELARAGEEGGMRVIFMMVMDPTTSKMREIPLHYEAPKQPKPKKGHKAPPAPVTIHCDDEEDMQSCAKKLAAARVDGAALVYQAP